MPQYSAHTQEILQRRPSEDFSPTPNPEQIPRKRGYSSISGAGEFVSPYQQQRSAPNWIPQEQQQPPRPAFPNSPYSTPLPGSTQLPTRDQNQQPPPTMVTQQKWVVAPDVGSSVEAVPHTFQSHGEDSVGWIDDNLIEAYVNFLKVLN